MVVIIRDRVQDLIDKGQTLEQIKAARVSLDFDGRYGSTTGAWTTDMFIEAVYRSLQNWKTSKRRPPVWVLGLQLVLQAAIGLTSVVAGFWFMFAGG